MANEQDKERTYNFLAFGIERRDLDAPKEALVRRNFSITFEPFSTSRRLNEFDGVILFQGIFERFERKMGYMNSYLAHTYDRDALDRRKNEAELLLGDGGLLCFLLNEPFIDHDDGRDFSGTDLTKYHLNYSNFYRDNFGSRTTQIEIKSDEFRDFLKIAGAASTHFHHYNKTLDFQVLAKANGKVVGMTIGRQAYFLPTLIPENRAARVEEYFDLLGNALVSSFNKIQWDLPEWITTFKFVEEQQLIERRDEGVRRIEEIDARLNQLNEFKAVLLYSGDQLVDAVRTAIIDGLGIPIDPTDEYKEDLKLLDAAGKPICFCEIKGVNAGVKREYLNQVDSHRERAGVSSDFPAMLIINTHIKNARSVAEKDQQVPNEQVLHAVRLGILVLRTIDLLGLIRLFLAGTLQAAEIRTLLTTNKGWLTVAGDEVVISQGT